MDFAHPLLLAGASLAAAPIILHLIMRRRPKHLEFPALRLVKRRQAANTRRLRLRHLLLLLLRIAALCLLAAALARPSIQASGVGGSREAPVAVALLFDTAARMQYRHENQTRLEAAQEMAGGLLKELPAESQVAVLESSLGSAVFQVDRGAAKQRIERLEMTPTAQPLVSVLEEALELLKTSELQRKEIYVFSDLAKSAWAADDARNLSEQLRRAGEVGLYIIDVGVEQPRNFGLGRMRLSGETLSKNTPLQVTAELLRLGPADSRSVELHLLDANRQPQKQAQQTVEVGENASQSLTLRGGLLDEGAHQGFVKIVGEDGLALDDQRWFTVEVQRAWPVLLAAPNVAQASSLGARPRQDAWATPEEYAFFLHQALAPEHFRKNDQARFHCDVVALDVLDKHPLDQYAAICLIDPTPLPPAVWKRLSDFAAAGGGVVLFLGRNAQQIDAFNSAAAQELLPGKLSLQARAPDGDVHLSPENFQHPVLAAFRGRASMIPWDMFPVYRYWLLDGLAPGAGVVIPYSDGQPALLEKPVGQGRVLTMTTPVSDPAGRRAWNELPTGLEPWPFVMLSNELLLYLVGSADEQLNYTAGQTAVLRFDRDSAASNYLLTTPTGDQFRRVINLDENAIIETSTGWIGNYRIQAGSQSEGLNRGFSVNLPPEATDLTRLSDPDLKRLFGDHPYQQARNQEQINRVTNLARSGWELYPLLILLVAVLMGGEHAMANRFYRE